jgi:hypothetical protein
MTGSALRRHIAEHLGIASFSDIKAPLPAHTRRCAGGRGLARRLLDRVDHVRDQAGAKLLEHDFKAACRRC